MYKNKSINARVIGVIGVIGVSTMSGTMQKVIESCLLSFIGGLIAVVVIGFVCFIGILLSMAVRGGGIQ